MDSAKLLRQTYGKHQVRVSKITRSGDSGDLHQLAELAVAIELEGDFEAAYTAGDNRLVVATDTCRNTVYALAKDHPLEPIECFGKTLANHFLTQYPHVRRVSIAIDQRSWRRMLDSSHAFWADERVVPSAAVAATRSVESPQAIEFELNAGFVDCLIAKTTQSGFADFHRDEFRTLPDTDERILATSMSASWTFIDAAADHDFASLREQIMGQLLATFIDHYSHSVQETLYRMASAVIERVPEIGSVTLTMPNKHHIRFNLEPFGKTNANEVFIVTDEPFGYIHATITRR